MTQNLTLKKYPVRTGVYVPDWTAVTSTRVREALSAIFEALDLDRMWRNYTPAEDQVRTALLRLYAEAGRAPDIGELAGRAGISEAVVRPILASLKARDLVVLDSEGERITSAYPFTDRQTEHRVRLGDRALHACCAIDALGVGAMYGRDVDIRSRCRHCAAPITIMTGEQGRSLTGVDPNGVVVWSGLRYEDRCAATSICMTIAFFCSDEHLEAWRTQHGDEGPGFRLSIEEALEAGRAVFAPSLAGFEGASMDGGR